MPSSFQCEFNFSHLFIPSSFRQTSLVLMIRVRTGPNHLCQPISNYRFWHQIIHSISEAVWPDGRIKSSPISSKVAKNVGTIVLTLKVILFKMIKQFSKYLGYFCNEICCQELQKSPIWSRWSEEEKAYTAKKFWTQFRRRWQHQWLIL